MTNNDQAIITAFRRFVHEGKFRGHEVIKTYNGIVVDIEQFILDQVHQETERCVGVAEQYLKDMYGSSRSIGGHVDVSSHDVNYLGNKLLSDLKQNKKEEGE